MNEAILDLTRFLAFELSSSYVACVYGSHVYADEPNLNDLDVLIAVPTVDTRQFQRLKQFIVVLHDRYGLAMDEEVPYENKLVVSYSDLQSAIQLNGFLFSRGSWIVPEVEKTASFLSSREIRLRLCLNALTSPHIYLGNDLESYLGFRASAIDSIVRLSLSLVGKPEPAPIELVEALLFGEGGRSGEYFLGYHNTTLGKSDLLSLVNIGLARLGKTGEVEFTRDRDQLRVRKRP